MKFLDVSKVTGATTQLIGVFQKIRENLASMKEAGSYSTEQLKSIFATISQSAEKSSWDMYYGVQAAQGKLTGNLKKDLSSAFATTPMERWGAQLQFMRTATKDWADLGDVWPAFTGMFEGVPEELTQKLGAALSSLDTKAITDMGKSPQQFMDSLIKKSNLAPDEIVTLQRTTAALENPMQSLVNVAFKIYDLLSTRLSGPLMKLLMGK
jgi:hypothetical protein